MPPSKSSFMFLVKPGETYQFELEAFFYNNTSKVLEPISASSKTIAREKKVQFGPIVKFNLIDEEILEIVNKADERIQLLRIKLSPMLDSQDSMLKQIILKFRDKSTSALLAALNALVDKFHEEDCKVISTIACEKEKISEAENIADTSEEERSILEEGNSFDKCSSVNLLSRNSSGRCSWNLSNAGSLYGDKRKKLKSDDCNSGDETVVSEGGVSSSKCGDDEQDLKSEVDGDYDDNDLTMNRINEVITEAHFMGIKTDKCEIPNSLLINKDIVARLKESLMKHPDKSQCVIGVVRVMDENEENSKMLGKFQVFVNPELFLAVQELSFEGFDLFGKDKIAAVVHTVIDSEALSPETLGIFLNKNSKEFSCQLRENLTYQDLIRFCCLTVSNQGQGADVKDFIKEALKAFDKGKHLTSLFLYFALMPTSYLNKFEIFLRLFETGSLPGQKLSSRKLCNVDKNRKRKKDFKLEIPLSLLKLHKNVSQVNRDKLLEDLLEHNIDFPKYCSILKLSSEICDVKKTVEHVAKTNFGEIKEKCPDLFEDSILKSFVGAKVTSSGQNAAYNRLVKHVNIALTDDQRDETPVEQPLVVCSHSDNLNLLNLGRKMKQFDMIICNMGMDPTFNQQNSLCIVEQVKDPKSKSVGIIIDTNDEKWREEMSVNFGESDIVFEYIYVKREETLVSNGFQKELQAIAVFGKKEAFENKKIKSFYNCTAKEAIYSIIADIVSVKSAVLYSFSEAFQAFELDPLGTLARKKISVEYLAKRTLLTPLATKINKKIVN